LKFPNIDLRAGSHFRAFVIKLSRTGPPMRFAPRKNNSPAAAPGHANRPMSPALHGGDLVIAGQVFVSLRLTGESACSGSTRCAIREKTGENGDDQAIA
jgi:hypothetical protein